MQIAGFKLSSRECAPCLQDQQGKQDCGVGALKSNAISSSWDNPSSRPKNSAKAQPVG